MTKQEAITQAKKGEKVTHRFFEPHEYLTFKDGYLTDETGLELSEGYFWTHRNTPQWETDWSIWINPATDSPPALTDTLLNNPMQDEEDYRDFLDAAYPDK